MEFLATVPKSKYEYGTEEISFTVGVVEPGRSCSQSCITTPFRLVVFRKHRTPYLQWTGRDFGWGWGLKMMNWPLILSKEVSYRIQSFERNRYVYGYKQYHVTTRGDGNCLGGKDGPNRLPYPKNLGVTVLTNGFMGEETILWWNAVIRTEEE